MGIFDKIKNVNLEELVKGTKGMLNEVGQKTSESLSGAVGEIKKYKENAKELNTPLEGALKRYGFSYQGGLPQYPKKKNGEVGLNIMEDCFYFKPTAGTVDWFEEMAIPYASVKKLEVVKRALSTSEYMLGSGDTKSLEQFNTVEINYFDENNEEQLLRIEMLTGFTVFKQAEKCKELMDVLRQNHILDQFKKDKKTEPVSTGNDIVGKIEQLAKLRDSGILTDNEFDTKKSELLKQI